MFKIAKKISKKSRRKKVNPVSTTVQKEHQMCKHNFGISGLSNNISMLFAKPSRLLADEPQSAIVRFADELDLPAKITAQILYSQDTTK